MQLSSGGRTEGLFKWSSALWRPASIEGPDAVDSLIIEPRAQVLNPAFGPHKGIFPCLRRGFVSTLFRSDSSPRMSTDRVRRGSITSST